MNKQIFVKVIYSAIYSAIKLLAKAIDISEEKMENGVWWTLLTEHNFSVGCGYEFIGMAVRRGNRSRRHSEGHPGAFRGILRI